MQLIDARDLSAWIIRLAEAKKAGVYNATGPNGALTFEPMLEQCKNAGGSDACFAWVKEKFLLDNGVAAFTDLPLWIPQRDKEMAGFFTVNGRRAFESGLTCRPLAETARDILACAPNPLTDAPGQNQVGLAASTERELLRAWKED